MLYLGLGLGGRSRTTLTSFCHLLPPTPLRVSVQGLKSLGDHFACLCQGFDFYEVNIYLFFQKNKGKYFYMFDHFYSEKSSKKSPQSESTPKRLTLTQLH